MSRIDSLTVLHVLNSASGGAAMSTIGLMKSLRSLGIHSCAVCDDRGTCDERALLGNAANGNVVFTPLYWWNRKIRSSAWKRPILEFLQLCRTGFKIASAHKVLQAAEKWRPDLIHTNTVLTPEGGMAARKLGIPHVWHVRELIGPNQPFQFSRTGRDFGSCLVRQCDHVIANSEITAAQISHLLPTGFVSVIPNGIDVSAFTAVKRAPGNGRAVVAMVASLSSRVKRHDLFIEGAGLVDRSLPIEWRIYGHAPSTHHRGLPDSYMIALRRMAQNARIHDSLRFPGHLPPAQIMSEIDLLVHPAECESFGRVVIEALAAKTPVVGANGGGVGEILTHEKTGLLFRPNDPSDMAICIERMIRDRHLARRCGEAGSELVQRKYSIGTTAQSVAQVYDNLLHNR